MKKILLVQINSWEDYLHQENSHFSVPKQRTFRAAIWGLLRWTLNSHNYLSKNKFRTQLVADTAPPLIVRRNWPAAPEK